MIKVRKQELQVHCLFSDKEEIGAIIRTSFRLYIGHILDAHREKEI